MGQIEKNEGRKPDIKGESVGGGKALKRSREEGRARTRCGTHWMSHLVCKWFKSVTGICLKLHSVHN